MLDGQPESLDSNQYLWWNLQVLEQEGSLNKKINLGYSEKHRVVRGEHEELETSSIVTARAQG